MYMLAFIKQRKHNKIKAICRHIEYTGNLDLESFRACQQTRQDRNDREFLKDMAAKRGKGKKLEKATYSVGIWTMSHP